MILDILTPYVQEVGVSKIIADYCDQMNEFEDIQEELRHYYKDNNIFAYISLIRDIPEFILEENMDYIKWTILLQHKRCSQEFLDKHFDLIREHDYSNNLFAFQQFSTTLLNKYKNRFTHIDWYYISYCQKLTPEFVKENKKNIVFYALANNRQIN